MVYPKENSVAVAVFTVALTIDVLAVLKLVKPMSMLFRSVICAASSQNIAIKICLGMSRLDRWECAMAFGLNPPKTIENLLKSSDVRLGCLWDGRV
ncbi:hypothetical protein LIER_08249 [Lithospermum erythrorhizon]|uniref:Uncharacterized protein n=1 Tax=Lithospermum erythrorhizon TaxID=34254 RepID=A0AAV3PBF8_LITER